MCWDCPGIEAIRAASSIPSRTNRGATRSSTLSRVSATSRRMAGVRRSRRIRRSGNAIAPAYGPCGVPESSDIQPRCAAIATTSPSTDARAGSTATERPAARAATDVVWPMHATTGGTDSFPNLTYDGPAATSARGGGASTVR